MAKINEQLTLGDIDDEYKKFVDKFKTKKTTDDCYTPANIYEAVLSWVVEEYGIDPNKVVRPFWPGGTSKGTTTRKTARSSTIRRFPFCRAYVRRTCPPASASFCSRHILRTSRRDAKACAT